MNVIIQEYTILKLERVFLYCRTMTVIQGGGKVGIYFG